MGNFSKAERSQILHDRVDLQLGGGLGTNTLTSFDSRVIRAANERGFRVLRSEIFITYNLEASDTTLLVGMAGPGMSATDTELAIEAQPLGEIDQPAVEQASRPVWPIAVVTGDCAADEWRRLNEGNAFVMKIRWSFPEEAKLTYWLYNLHATSSIPAGTHHVIIYAKHYGVWLKD